MNIESDNLPGTLCLRAFEINVDEGLFQVSHSYEISILGEPYSHFYGQGRIWIDCELVNDKHARLVILGPELDVDRFQLDPALGTCGGWEKQASQEQDEEKPLSHERTSRSNRTQNLTSTAG